MVLIVYRQMYQNTCKSLWSASITVLIMQVEAENVKVLSILNSTFARIPWHGMKVSKTGKLEIKDNRFLSVVANSIQLEKTKFVEVMNNQFSLNAHQVIEYKDGSSVMISCNRLLGDYVRPECFPTTTTTTTTTTTQSTRRTSRRTTTSRPSTARPVMATQQTISSVRDSQEGSGIITALVILLSLILIILTGVLAAVCFLKWNNIKKELLAVTASAPLLSPLQEEAEPVKAEIPVPPPPPPPVELETLLSSATNAQKAQLFTPIWLDEIQNNKIYIKYQQRAKEKEQMEKEQMEREKLNQNNSEDSDVDGKKNYSEKEHLTATEEKENSRTESDQE